MNSGFLLPSIVEQRFVYPAIARARIRGNILEAESFDYIDHEVGTRAVQSQNIDFG